MEIRKATEEDIPEILRVLKLSLGETSSQKTEKVWRYKHIDNPFGRSLVLLAVENNEIIGIRAFMKWKWQLGEKVLSAFRAVDTATHPNHQGKGVFKKLTLHAIEMTKNYEEYFVFNTPNSQSLPGYLKMGWEKVDKLVVNIKPSNPFNWLKDLEGEALYNIDENYSEEEFERLVSKCNKLEGLENKLFTLKSPEYLSWRYKNNSLQEYEVMADEDFFLAGYIKKHKYFKELRVSEHLYFNEIGLLKLNNAVEKINKKFGAQVVTSTGLNSLICFSGKYGPVLTLRDINMELVLKQDLLQLNNWSYTLGDLELF